jgi:Lipopolysaccharide-assembly
MGFRVKSGRSRVLDGLTVAFAIGLGGCYSFSGGGGFPSDVRTIFIAQFENKTTQFDLDSELFRKLTESVPRSLGLRTAGEQVADAILRGRITRYDDTAQSYQPGQSGNVQVLQNQVTITLTVEIVDVKRNEILWESQSVIGRGEYRPDSQQDRTAWEKALDSVIQQIVDGAQSQW